MSDVVIDIQSISKRYRLGVIGARTFREELSRCLKRVRERTPMTIAQHTSHHGSLARESKIWALKDVSFRVTRGEVTGLIGRNGAGKSTLLKILTRITDPTGGRAVLRGRVGSLLEVGTGFHPELTGRENIYLNGAILGMKSREIDERFEEMVLFSGVEDFIDTPVKRYSSGMRVRLGFAVAAHLEPEILLIDEVLAVGDIEFQRRCLGKMESIARGGRTVLFVSHNMVAISNLCPRSILLENGSVRFDGDTDEAIRQYTSGIRNSVNANLSERKDRRGTQQFRFTGCRIAVGKDHDRRAVVHAGEDARILLDYELPEGRPLSAVQVSCRIVGGLNQSVCLLGSQFTGDLLNNIPVRGVVECEISRLPLQPGEYSVTIFAVVQGQIADWVSDAGTLCVGPGDFYGSGRMPNPGSGSVVVPHSWRVSPHHS